LAFAAALKTICATPAIDCALKWSAASTASGKSADLTRSWRHVLQLQASNKELESFAYSVSHDLRAPLRHVVGFSGLLQRQASASLDALIDDLLSFSRIGRAEARMSSVDLKQLVKEIVAEITQETGGREISWIIAALPVCCGDRSMLKLVITNLLSNAVKFTSMRARAEIEIGCVDVDPQLVEVFVKDNGAGSTCSTCTSYSVSFNVCTCLSSSKAPA
jgi:light-regulated signal transduction histidine kinase (bacteriophytochrome)